MSIRVAINGYGRIGRNILRAHYEGGRKHDLQFVAINDLGNAQTNAHLTRYDTTHGKFPGAVAVEGEAMVVNGDRIRVCAKRNPAELPWKDLKIDVVLECTGLFTSKEKASAHLRAGAKKVVISAPGEKDVDRTIVVGVNDNTLKASDTVISNGSCTTNCLAPLVKALDDRIGVVSGLMTTVHAYTNDQVLTDVYHKDLRGDWWHSYDGFRKENPPAAGIPSRQDFRPVEYLIPSPKLAALVHATPATDLFGSVYQGFRVPTLNVSIVDFSFVAKRPTTVDEVNSSVKQASESDLRGILEYNKEPLVSSDFNHNPASSIFDATLTKVVGGTLVKVSSWYDNEWGFSNRMLDATVAFVNAT